MTSVILSSPIVAPATKFDRAAIHTHIGYLHGAAARAEIEGGKLCLAVYGKDPDTDERFANVQHFAVGDVDGMTDAAMAFEGRPHHNPYSPLVVFKPETPAGTRKQEDIAAVFGLVIDGDADKGKARPTSPLPADYIIESSAGNFQEVLFLDRPLPLQEARAYARALERATGADCADEIGHVWRIPGGLNWPDAVKIKRGRPRDPQPVRVHQPWTKWTSVAELRAVLEPHWQAPRAERPAGADSESGRYGIDDAKKLYQWLADNGAITNDEEWRMTGMVARFEWGDTGLELWEILATEGGLDNESLSRWKSFKTPVGRDPARLGTLTDLAHKAGWKGTVRESAAWMFRDIVVVFDEETKTWKITGPAYTPRTDLPPMPPPGPSEGYYEEEAMPALAAPQPFVWRDPRTIPMMPWLYGKHLLRGCVSLTVAPSGVGKTFLKVMETTALVTGRMLLHDKPVGKLRCWFYNGEEPMEILERRFHAAFLHHKLTPADIGDRLFVNDRTTKMVIAKTTRDGVTIVEPIKELLISYIRENRIDVLSIDPFVSAHAVTENDNIAIDQVVKAYADVAQETNCAIDLVHHARKTNGAVVGIEDARGASAMIGAVRAARTMNCMSPEEAKAAGIESRFRYVRIDDAKPNHAPRSEQAQWVQFQGVYLGNGPMGFAGDNVAAMVKWQWPDAMAGVTSNSLAAVWEAIRAANWRESSQATDWVGKPVAEALGLDLERPADLAKVKSLIHRWVKSGELIKVDGLDSQRKTKIFIECATLESSPPLANVQ